MKRSTIAGLTGLAATVGLMAAAPALAPHVKWMGDLRPVGTYTFVSGKATMETSPRGDSTVVSLTLIGADTSSAHPWHVHRNECGAKTGGELASLSSFPPVSVTSTSSDPNAPMSGSASVTLPMRTPMKGKYSVQVYESTKDTAIVIACGDLMRHKK